MSESKQKDVANMLMPIIKQCENALLSVSGTNGTNQKSNDELYILGRFLALKLFLLLQVERFGCNLVYKVKQYNL